ncbi:MAG: hypothetical protein HZA54_11090 [Planctomycetes bacterium]|nr:hypothetical protein [Planctomycetota bacterium]
MARATKKSGEGLPEPLRARVDAIAERVKRRPSGRRPLPSKGKPHAWQPPQDPEAE